MGLFCVPGKGESGEKRKGIAAYWIEEDVFEWDAWRCVGGQKKDERQEL
jgi:hypothetical protein